MANLRWEEVARRIRSALPWLLVGGVVYWFLPTWFLHVRRTLDPFTFNDDARILIWPFLRERDPNLFRNDPFVDYYRAGLPEGFLLLYRIAGRLGWVRATSEVLQYLSAASVVLILAVTARKIGGRAAAFFAIVLALGSDSFLERAGGGLPRAFAFPLVSAGAYALVSGRPRLLAILAIVGAAFYPVVSALLGLCLFLLLVLPEPYRTDSSKPFPKPLSLTDRGAMLTLTLLGIVVLLAPMAVRIRSFGEPILPSMLTDFPEAGLGGRLTPDQHPPFEGFATLFVRHLEHGLFGAGEPLGGRIATWLRRTDQTKNLILLLVMSLAALGAFNAGAKRPAFVRLGLLPMAASMGHALACIAAPRLFLPERYAQYAVPTFGVLFVAAAFGVGWDEDGSCSVAPYPRGLGRAGLIVSRVLGMALLGCLLGRGTSWAGIEVYVRPQERALYDVIAKLPRDSVIAGWPAGPLENVPYLSERRVLTNFQLEMPFHTRFTLDSRARVSAFFDAYLATQPGPLRRLCAEWKVTHLLIDQTHFSATLPDYYAPHRDELARRVAEMRRGSPYALALFDHPSAVHFPGGLALVDLSRIDALSPECSQTSAP